MLIISCGTGSPFCCCWCCWGVTSMQFTWPGCAKDLIGCCWCCWEDEFVIGVDVTDPLLAWGAKLCNAVVVVVGSAVVCCCCCWVARLFAYWRIGLSPWDCTKLSILERVKIEAGSGLSPRWQSDSKDFQRNGFSFKALRSALMAWKTATINSIFYIMKHL